MGSEIKPEIRIYWFNKCIYFGKLHYSQNGDEFKECIDLLCIFTNLPLLSIYFFFWYTIGSLQFSKKRHVFSGTTGTTI